jgi:threo-3-hydroxy-L-aspartate ammonia-lyase
MLAEIHEARNRLRGRAHITPVMTSGTLNELAAAEVFLKCESFQRTGSFKFRGAFNAVAALPEEQRRFGLVTYSSGNHGQALALVGLLHGTKVTVVVPADTNPAKLEAMAAYGATVIKCTADRSVIARDLHLRHGFTLIPPFDRAEVIAGQGTAALEFFDQVKRLDVLLVPCGGGGLLSGCAIAAKSANPDCQVIGIEPAMADDATRSFQTRTLQTIDYPATIADGTRTLSLGELTFPLILDHVDDMKTVTEEAILDAVRFLFLRMKLVVEPSGALGVAALLSGVVTGPGRIGVVLSGGNIDPEILVKAATVTSPSR